MNKYKENLDALDNARLTINKLCGKWLPREILDNLEEYGDYELYNYIKYSVFKELVDKETPMNVFKESLQDALCVKCGTYINFDMLNNKIEHAPKYCANCGQRINFVRSEE